MLLNDVASLQDKNWMTSLKRCKLTVRHRGRHSKSKHPLPIKACKNDPCWTYRVLEISFLGSRAVEHIDIRFINCSWLFYISRRFLLARWDDGPINKLLVVCTDLLKCEHFLTALYGRNHYFSGCCILLL